MHVVTGEVGSGVRDDALPGNPGARAGTAEVERETAGETPVLRLMALVPLVPVNGAILSPSVAQRTHRPSPPPLTPGPLTRPFTHPLTR